MLMKNLPNPLDVIYNVAFCCCYKHAHLFKVATAPPATMPQSRVRMILALGYCQYLLVLGCIGYWAILFWAVVSNTNTTQ